MSEMTNYYYMRLKDDFYDSDEIIALETMKDGHKYINMLLKLYLKSLKDGGRLMLKGVIPYDISTIAHFTRLDESTVACGLEILKKLELIQILDSGAIYMMNIQELIGKSSNEAERKKRYRMRIEQEKQQRKQICANDIYITENAQIEQEIETIEEYAHAQMRTYTHENAHINEQMRTDEHAQMRTDAQEFVQEIPKNTEMRTETCINDKNTGQMSDERPPKYRDQSIDNIYNNICAKTCASDSKSASDTRTLNKQKSEDMFNELWKLYPNKKGKGRVSDTQKLKLYKTVGLELMKTAIQKYNEHIKKNRISQQYIMHGSTFFNSGYIDYVEEIEMKVEEKEIPNATNWLDEL